MSQTGYPAFDTTVQKTNQVLKEIDETYGWPRHHSYGAVRAVLHALRDRLTVAEAAHLAAQLPMLLRGLYYEGWNPSRVPVKMDRDELIARIEVELPFEVEDGVEVLINRVLQAVRRFVTDGEWHDISASLPKDLAALLPS